MTDPFEYDVFISFSSIDEELVKPIWQELCSNGLRVFWSDATLKKEVGNSWFEIIEKSIEQSKHMLLICSDNSMNSKWVQREYRAFFDYCYSPNSRRLIPLLAHEFKPNDLPLFLRQLQVGKANDHEFIREIIPILGGVNIEKLQLELQSLRKQVGLLSIENKSLKEQVAKLAKVKNVQLEEDTLTASETNANNEVEITKADFAGLTYRQKFVVTEYGYLLSPDDAEVVGNMLGKFEDKNIPTFCAQRGQRVISLER